MQTMSLKESIAATLLGLTIGVIATMYAYEQGQKNPPCFEDEVYKVQLDTNPAHGLTWKCEPLDNLK